MPLGRTIANRLAFYATVVGLMWLLGELTPSETDRLRAQDRELGVPPAFIAVPVQATGDVVGVRPRSPRSYR